MLSKGLALLNSITVIKRKHAKPYYLNFMFDLNNMFDLECIMLTLTFDIPQ